MTIKESQMKYLAANLYDVSKCFGYNSVMDLSVGEVRDVFPSEELTEVTNDDIFSLIADIDVFNYYIS